MLIDILRGLNRLINYIKFKRDRLRLQNLMRRGLKIGRNVYIFENVEFDHGYPYLIEVGDNCNIAKNVTILAHDGTTFRALGATRIEPVKILEGSFIGQNTIILPGVTIGPRALVAAGSVVNRSIPEGKVAAGNPARPYGNFADIIERYKNAGFVQNIFDIGDIEQDTIPMKEIAETVAQYSIGFIKGVPKLDRFYVNADMDEIRRDANTAFERNFPHISPGKKRR